MGYEPHGKHLIAGDWVSSQNTFTSQPVGSDGTSFCEGGADEVDRAVRAAEEAFATYGWTSREDRAAFLEAIAEEIDARGDDITRLGCAETGLPEARLQGERGRTTGQLRLFAEHIRDGAYLDRRHDAALPDRAPLPRPDLKMVQRPIGPVGVFGASNFPLAFSTAGGDTASALAAGCPVIVKGHEAHPGTCEVVAEAILAAIVALSLDPGVFSLVHGGAHEVGQALVQHPLVQAVGFTGGLRGGRALFDLCAARPVPIPFFGELGSVNPMFILPHAVDARGDAIAEGWAASLILGAGQFCTNPGVAILVDGPATEAFIKTVTKALAASEPQIMLTQGIADAYGAGKDRLGGSTEVARLLSSESAA